MITETSWKLLAAGEQMPYINIIQWVYDCMTAHLVCPVMPRSRLEMSQNCPFSTGLPALCKCNDVFLFCFFFFNFLPVADNKTACRATLQEDPTNRLFNMFPSGKWLQSVWNTMYALLKPLIHDFTIYNCRHNGSLESAAREYLFVDYQHYDFIITKYKSQRDLITQHVFISGAYN